MWQRVDFQTQHSLCCAKGLAESLQCTRSTSLLALKLEKYLLLQLPEQGQASNGAWRQDYADKQPDQPSRARILDGIL